MQSQLLGTVYVTPTVATPTVIVSKDNGFSWFERTMGEDAGTPNPERILFQPIQIPMHITYGLELMKEFISAEVQILERVGNRKASE